MQYEDGGKSVDEKLEKLKRPYDEDRPTIGQMLLEAAAEDRRRAKRQGALEALRELLKQVEDYGTPSTPYSEFQAGQEGMQCRVETWIEERIEALEKEESDAEA